MNIGISLIGFLPGKIGGMEKTAIALTAAWFLQGLPCKRMGIYWIELKEWGSKTWSKSPVIFRTTSLRISSIWQESWYFHFFLRVSVFRLLKPGLRVPGCMLERHLNPGGHWQFRCHV